MTYDVIESDGVIFLKGYVSVDDVVALRKRLESYLDNLKPVVIFDLSELESAHSAILSLLLCLMRKAEIANAAVKFRGVSERLLNLASVSQLQHLCREELLMDAL